MKITEHIIIRKGYGLLFIIMVLTFQLRGEGTKQLLPDSTISGAGLYIDNSPGTVYTNFAVANCPSNYRLNIHVKNVGEYILFGFETMYTNIPFTLRKPNGSVALTGIIPYTTGQTGYILYYHQAIVGPYPSYGGYTPLSYHVTNIADTGNYYFEIPTSVTYAIEIDMWDFQVVSGQHSPAIPSDAINGRVWSQSWQVYASLGYSAYDYQPFNGSFYVYADDGIVTKLAFSNAAVGAVTIFCNPYGCLNTGNFPTDRQSNNTNTFLVFPNIAQYKVFLNDPDSTVYPSGFYGSIIGTPYIIPDPNYPPCSCNKKIVVDVDKAGKIQVDITFPYGAPGTNVSLYSDVIPGINYIPWNGLDGQGNAVPDGTQINVNVQYMNGLTNLPVWDQEMNPNGYIITLVRPSNSSGLQPPSFWDDSQLVPNTYGDPCNNPPQTVDFTGCTPGSLPGYTGCHPWHPIDGYCHNKMINTWWYGSTTSSSFICMFAGIVPNPVGHGASHCGPDSLFLHATVLQNETVDWYTAPSGGSPILFGDTSFITPIISTTTTYYAEARNDSSGCESSVRIPVVATISSLPVPTIMGTNNCCVFSTNNSYKTESGMTAYIWNVSIGGNITSGLGTDSITVFWNSPGQQYVSVLYTNQYGCSAENPTLFNVNVDPLPGFPGYITGPSPVCAGSTGLIYSVFPVTDAISYFWTLPSGFSIVSGSGTNSITVNADSIASSGNITVYTTNQCGSGPFSPPFHVVVNHAPEGSAGPDGLTCQMVPFAITQASAINDSAVQWHSNGMGTLTGASTLFPIYTPAQGEIGQVTLALIIYGKSPCSNDTSMMILEIEQKASANGGGNINTCGQKPVVLSNSMASNYQSLLWTTSGSGSFDDPSILHPTYFPSSSDVDTGSIYLTLYATSMKPCNPDSDKVLLIIQKPVYLNAGPDTSICQNESVTLNKATATDYTILAWSTSGDGTFNNPNIVNPVYTPGINDILQGKSELKVSAEGNYPCESKMDSLLLTINRKPEVHPGPDGVICQGMTFTVDGVTATDYSHLTWNDDGQGVFEGTSTLNPVYTPGSDETGTVILTLRVYGNLSCHDSIASCQIKLKIYTPVKVNAGEGQTINYDTVTILHAIANGGTGNYSYLWEPSSLVYDDTVNTPQTLPLKKDTVFIVTATDKITGCSASDSLKINVVTNEGLEPCLVIHNVITPNGDGLNDTWIIDCIENFPDNTVQIFNRWGELINSFDHYDNTTQVWDGTNFNRRLLPAGTYYYVLKIKNEKPFTGWIFLRCGLK